MNFKIQNKKRLEQKLSNIQMNAYSLRANKGLSQITPKLSLLLTKIKQKFILQFKCVSVFLLLVFFWLSVGKLGKANQNTNLCCMNTSQNTNLDSVPYLIQDELSVTGCRCDVVFEEISCEYLAHIHVSRVFAFVAVDFNDCYFT